MYSSDLERSSVIAQRLRELPTELAPPMSWAQFQQRSRARRAARSAQGWRYAALAAGVAALVAGLALWSRVSLPVHRAGEANLQAELPMLTLPDQQTIAQQAEASERWLAYLPAEPAVMRVGTRGAVTDLEDRIAWMDDALSAQSLEEAVNPTHIAALQHERARLINSLAQVRYAETLAAQVP